jgi:hypothetical protein
MSTTNPGRNTTDVVLARTSTVIITTESHSGNTVVCGIAASNTVIVTTGANRPTTNTVRPIGAGD